MNSMNNAHSLKVTPKLFCLHLNECDPKKCTALKLNKFNLLKIILRISEDLKRAIILNPFALKVISQEDRKIVLKKGLIVIDCSWNKKLDLSLFNQGLSRKLPPLIAANPINYGKWEKLSSAEAITSALFLTKFNETANEILSKFSWGNEFKRLNNF